MLEHNVRRLGSVGPVEGAFGDLDDKRGVGEGQSLEICGILTNPMSDRTIKTRVYAEARTGVGMSAPVMRSTGASR